MNPNVITLGIGPGSDITHLILLGLSERAVSAGFAPSVAAPFVVRETDFRAREAWMYARESGARVREVQMFPREPRFGRHA